MTMLSKSSGCLANDNGAALKESIANILIRRGYAEISKKKFLAARFLRQPFFTREFTVGKSIYGTDLRSDLIIYHPDKHPGCLIIESKWQQSTGSVDEKYPFLVLSLKQKEIPYPAIVVLDGGGYKSLAEDWLRKQIDDKLLNVFSMMEFRKWSNSGKI